MSSYPVARRTNGMAIASLVCSVGGLFVCPLAVLLGPIFGFIARGQIRRSNGAETGNGLALAGIIVGLVVIAIAIAFLVVVVLIGITASNTNSSR
jgi:hypothetical protein